MLQEALERTGVAGLIGWDDRQDNEDNIIRRAWAAALYPFQLAISPPAIKVYLTIFLFSFTSTVLLSISTTAFGLFYYNYIPQTDLERPIYLQYDSNRYPYAEGSLNTNALISQQPYDIAVVLHMPRDPVNMATGNFMLDLTLHSNAASKIEATVLKTLNMEDQVPSSALHHSRRPALIPYASPHLDLVSKLLHLPLHLLSFHDSDAVILTIPLFEAVEFARGKDNIPTSFSLSLQTQRPPDNKIYPATQLQVYSAKITFHARLHGLRYLIYNYRLISFIVFSALFYTVSVSSLAVIWALIAFFSGQSSPITSQSLVKKEQDKRIKQEPGLDTSDHLRSTTDYKSDKTPRIKGTDESDQETINMREVWTGATQGTEFTPRTSETASATASQDQPGQPEGIEPPPDEHADDEEEGSEDEWEQLQRVRRRMELEARQRQLARQQNDSGIGTSMDSENAMRGGGGVVRRTSGRKGGGEKD